MINDPPRIVTKATYKRNQPLLTIVNELYFGRQPMRKLALRLARILGESGEFFGFRLLAASYDYGTGTRRDAAKAFHFWFAASKLGDSYSQSSLAYAFDRGLGVGVDKRKALGHFQKLK